MSMRAHFVHICTVDIGSEVNSDLISVASDRVNLTVSLATVAGVFYSTQ